MFHFLCLQILIEGTVGDDFNGDIAIDDLSFLDCVPYDGKSLLLCYYTKDESLLCFFFFLRLSKTIFFFFYLVVGELPTVNVTPPAVTTAAPTVQPHSCPDGEFACVAYGECVPHIKVCDFRQDCSDGSDETNCGKVSSCFLCITILSLSHRFLLIYRLSLCSEGEV